MSGALRGVVVGHAGVAEALVAAAEEISGVRGVLRPVTNAGADRAALEQRVADAATPGPAVVFVDLPSGSCLVATLRHLPNRSDLKVVTGVNLVMLLDFLLHLDRTPEEAARRAVETGARSIGER